MINKKENYVEWALLLYELDDAQEKLAALMDNMSSDDDFCEIDY